MLFVLEHHANAGHRFLTSKETLCNGGFTVSGEPGDLKEMRGPKPKGAVHVSDFLEQALAFLELPNRYGKLQGAQYHEQVRKWLAQCNVSASYTSVQVRTIIKFAPWAEKVPSKK